MRNTRRGDEKRWRCARPQPFRDCTVVRPCVDFASAWSIRRLRLGSPGSFYNGSADFYVPIDFTGWRCFELVEPDSKRSGNWTNSLYWQHVDSFSLWFEDVPRGKTVSCYVSPIRALPAVASEIRNPSITVGGKTITFPVTLKTNCYLEFNSITECKLYSAIGELLAEVKPIGDAPVIEPGENTVEFACEVADTLTPRSNVTVISESWETLPAQLPAHGRPIHRHR